MAKKTKNSLDKGDWLVHQLYGVGEIKAIEKRPLDGEMMKCYRVKTRESTYWVPVDKVDNPRIRPVGSRYRLKRALKALKGKAKPMDKDYKKRRKRIREALKEGTLISMARIVRDLHARRKEKKLNPTETEALDLITTRLTREWAVIMEIDTEKARQKLHQIT